MTDSKMGKGRRQSGFTLLEVVVAMAIVGLGVLTLIEIFSQGLRLGSRSYERTEAATYGRRVMNEILARREIQDGGEDGSVTERYRWRLQVEPHEEESASLSPTNWKLKEITVEIQYRVGERKKKIEMKTLRLVKNDQ